MVIVYKCPNCSAPMVFDPEKQMLTCEYCKTTIPVKEYEARYGAPVSREETEEEKARSQQKETVEKEEEGTRADYDSGETMEVKKYRCSSCGAELITDGTTAATICSFCGNPTLLEDRVSGEKKPAQVIPFKITKGQAESKFRQWTKRGKLTPGSFRSASTIEKITGIYVPFWLVDYNSNVKLHAHCTRTRTTRSGAYEYIYTDHYEVYRDVDAAFQKIPMDASEKMDDNTMDLLEPFDYSQLTEFNMPYLSGYMAESYSYTDRDMEERGKSRVREYAVTAARNTISGYSGVAVTEQTLRIDESSAEYVMLPVWMLNYRYMGKNYQFAINGQSGKMVGKLPVSKGRAAAWFFGLTAVLSSIVIVAGGFIL